MMSIEERLAEYRARKSKQSLRTESAADVRPSVRSESSSLSIVPVFIRNLFYFIFTVLTAVLYFITSLLTTVLELVMQPIRSSSYFQHGVRRCCSVIGQCKNTQLVKTLDNAWKHFYHWSKLSHLVSEHTIFKLIGWLIGWAVFIHLEFGAVYFIISLMCFVYFTTSNQSAVGGDKGPSAYSVFNVNCERLDGTFTTEQFEKELRFGAASVGH